MNVLDDKTYQSIDQGSDIEIPIIEIAEGWTVDQLENLDDCDDAFAYLTGAMCSIESKISIADELGTNIGPNYRRLKNALRWKKAALQIVQVKRGKIGRAMRQAEHKSHDRAIIDTMRDMFPKELAEVFRRVQANKHAAATLEGTEIDND